MASAKPGERVGAPPADPAAGDHEPGAQRVPPIALLAILASLAALAVLVVAVDPLRHAIDAALHGDTARVRAEIRDLGIGGPLIVLFLCLIHAVLFYPAEIVDAAAGFAFGFGPALALVMAGWMLNGWVAYGIGHTVAHPLLRRAFGPARFERAEAMVARGGATLLLSVRLVPIFPFSLMSYAAGAARVPAWRFTWTTAVGYLPITALATYLGSRLENLHPTDPLVLGAVVVTIGLLFALRWIGSGQRSQDPQR